MTVNDRPSSPRAPGAPDHVPLLRDGPAPWKTPGSDSASAQRGRLPHAPSWATVGGTDKPAAARGNTWVMGLCGAMGLGAIIGWVGMRTSGGNAPATAQWQASRAGRGAARKSSFVQE